MADRTEVLTAPLVIEYPFSRTTGRKLEAGELVVIECAVCVNGYWADITRTGAVRGKHVDLAHEAVFAAVHEAQARAVRAVSFGMPDCRKTLSLLTLSS